MEQPSEDNTSEEESLSSNNQETSEEDEEVIIDGITINYNGQTTIQAGSKVQLSATLSWTPSNLPLPEEQKNIFWRSNQELVATVDDTGLVNFLSFSGASATPKQVTITAESEWGFCEDSITFTVNPAIEVGVTPPSDGTHTHTEAYDNVAGEYPCCGERVQDGAPIVNSYNNAIWGWGNVGTWTHIAKNLTGDYSVTVKYNTKTNLSSVSTNDVAAHTLVAVSEQLPEGASGYGSCWISRMDWWQWCDQWQSSERLTDELNKADGGGNGGINNVNDIEWVALEKYKTIFTDCGVELTYSRTGTTLRNDYKIYDKEGNVYTYWTEIHNVSTTKNITLSLVCEQSSCTITSIKYNKVTFA